MIPDIIWLSIAILGFSSTLLGIAGLCNTKSIERLNKRIESLEKEIIQLRYK